MLFFLHIPKTAGSTFRSIARRYFQPEQIMDRRALLLYCRAHGIPDSDRHRIPFETALEWLSPEIKSGVKCLYAHMRYGMHQFFPGHGNYLTILREPVARFISGYYYVLRQQSNPLHEAVKCKRIEDFFELDTLRGFGTEFDLSKRNLQTRMISGISDPDNPEILSVAKERLREDFSYFGISELFDESLVGFSQSPIGRHLAWPVLYYTPRNVGSNYKRDIPLPPNFVETVKERNKLDIALYEYALDLFKKNISKIPDFDAKLQRFKNLNLRYQRLNRFLSGKMLIGKDLAALAEKALVMCAARGKKASRILTPRTKPL